MGKNDTNTFLSDEELVHRYQNSHDTAYIGELYIRYTHLVYGVCMKYFRNEADAQDAVMQIFEKLISDLKKHHIIAFKPWLYMVVKNHCMMTFRKESTEQKRVNELKKSATDSVEKQETEHLQEEQERELVLQHLKTGMFDLKMEQKECIELFYLKEKSYQQIVDETGYTMNEVKSHIQNGKRNLKIFIINKSNGKAE